LATAFLTALLALPLFPSTAAAATSYLITREGSTYRATPQGTGTTFTGTLKQVMESVGADLRNGGGGTMTFATGVFDFGTEYFKGENLSNITFQGQGIDVTVIQNNSSASADTEPFNMSSTNRVTVRDMTVIAGGSLRSSSDALDFDGGNDVVVERVKVSRSRGRGIVFDGKDVIGGVPRSAERNLVKDCVITGVQSDGIELLASSDNRIEGCTITNVGGHGLQITKSSTGADQPSKKSNDNVLTANSIDNSGQDGINLNSGDRNEIVGNTVLNSANVTSGRDGIRLSSADSVNCDDNVVSNNTSGDNQATHTQRWGLNIASSRCNRTTVWQNTFFGNLSGPINDLGTNTRYAPPPSTDTQPPTTPGTLSATAVSSSRVDLSWGASTDNVGVTGYEIFRNGSLLTTVGTVTTYSDTTVSPSTTYSYQVRARDAAGNRSAFGNTATVTTPSSDAEPPTDPGLLAAIATSSQRVELAWTASTDNVGVTGYEIFRDGTLLAAIGTQTTYADAAVEPLTTYSYQVRARDAADNRSGFSNAATVTTPPSPPDTEPPTAPSNLSATAVSPNRVDLSWTASSDNEGVTGYEIFRDGSLLAEEGAVTSYSDGSVSPSTTYSYQVRARDTAGNRSAFSSPATVTTPAPAVFSDGFESGNLSAWTSSTGLTVQQQHVFAGTWAARGTSTGSATWAYRQLGSTYGQLYYRIRFKVISQSTASNSTLYFLKFRTATGTSLLGVFRSPTGRLGYRNDVAGAATTSSTTITTGVWHEVQVRLRINGASSETETWFDGVRIAALSKTESLGTSPIGRIQIGENSTGRTYDLAIDEVAAGMTLLP
jgi:parallel beta-helix repeat protein